MQTFEIKDIEIRSARPEEYSEIGALLVETYSRLPGMPSLKEQPEYYDALKNVTLRASNSSIKIVVALSKQKEVLGTVDFIEDLKHYGANEKIQQIKNGSGMRLLAVSEKAQGLGLGKVLANYCVERSRELKKDGIYLHTTQAMPRAWGMYERMGFSRFEEIDFFQQELPVFGFKLEHSKGLATSLVSELGTCENRDVGQIVN